MKITRVTYRLLIAGLTVMAATGLGSSAVAASGGTGHTVTQTLHQHGTWTEEGDNDFCTGDLITVTITGNAVMHTTYFPGGDEAWGTFTEAGTATFVQPTNGLTYNGHVTAWGNFNVNNQNSNNTFVASFNLVAVDDNGATHTEAGHELFHITYNAETDQQPVVTFGKMSVTCS